MFVHILYPIPVRGVELTQGGLPAVHGLCGVMAMGPGLWTAEAGDVILTSSQHQHSPYLLSSIASTARLDSPVTASHG